MIIRSSCRNVMKCPRSLALQDICVYLRVHDDMIFHNYILTSFVTHLQVFVYVFLCFFQVVSLYSHLTSLYLTIFPHTRRLQRLTEMKQLGLKPNPITYVAATCWKHVFFWGTRFKRLKIRISPRNCLVDLIWNSYVTEVLDLF